MTKKEIAPASSTHNLLTAGTIITGNIQAVEDLRIDGVVEGNITSKGKIIIGQSSDITGDINCSYVEIWGKLKGNITCNGIVLIRVSGILQGNIQTQTLEIEPGATFIGSCSMNDQGLHKTIPPER